MAIAERPLFKEPRLFEPFPGVRLAPYKIDNQQLAADLSARRRDKKEIPDLSERIGKVTGIEFRFSMQPADQTPVSHNESVPKMATFLARAEISRAKWRTQDVNKIVFLSTYPLTSQDEIAHKIGLQLDDLATPETIDVYSACSGSTVALAHIGDTAHHGQNILLVGAEHYSANMNPTDLNRAIFSDGGATAAIRYGEDFEIINRTDLFHEDSDAIKAPVGKAPYGSISYNVPYAPKFEMNGRAVKEWVLNGEPVEQALQLYRQAHKGRGAIYVLSHQASGTTLVEYFKQLSSGGIPESAFPPLLNVSQIGNLGAASALAELRVLASKIRLRKGDQIIMEAYGAGITAQGVTLRVLRDNPFRPAF